VVRSWCTSHQSGLVASLGTTPSTRIFAPLLVTSGRLFPQRPEGSRFSHSFGAKCSDFALYALPRYVTFGGPVCFTTGLVASLGTTPSTRTTLARNLADLRLE
jgi:hypothetical protein